MNEEFEAIALSQEQEKEIAQHVKKLWGQWEDASKSIRSQWLALENAHRCRIRVDAKVKEKWRSQTYLPWAYNANRHHISYHASSLWPNDFEVFALKPKSREDVDALPFMQKLMEEALGRDKVQSKLLQILTSWTIKGMGISKIIQGPDGPTIDIINPNDFGFYPLIAPLSRCAVMQRIYRFKEELEQAKEQGAPYGNLDKIEQGDERQAIKSYAQSDTLQRDGIKLIECWMPRLKLKDGTVFANVVATVAAERVLIRFQANSPSPPFMVSALKPYDDQSVLGLGLCFAGLPILNTAVSMQNKLGDALTLGVNPMLQYNRNSNFKPQEFVSRPLALVAVDEQTNLQPVLVPFDGVIQANQQIEWYKQEFEEATIPRNLRGALDQGDRTAYETLQANQNASTDIAQSAKQFSDEQLEPWLRAFYEGIAQRIQQAQQNQDTAYLLKVARIGLETKRKQQAEDGSTYEERIPNEDLLQMIPEIPPADEIEIDIVGYQNVALRDSQLQFITTMIPQLAQLPGALDMVNGQNLLKKVFRLGKLDPEADLLGDDEIMANAKAQQEQAQAMAEAAQRQQEILNQQQQYLLDTQRMAEELKDERERAKLMIEESAGLAKLQIDAAKVGLEADAAKFEQQIAKTEARIAVNEEK